MPTKTWQPPSRQSDSDISPNPVRADEPRNFEPAHREPGGNSDVPSDLESAPLEDDEINTHGSER
jgi:hypothetical protein